MSDSGCDPRVALGFFRSSGKAEKLAAGTTIFAEKEKGSRLLLKASKMYLLLSGEVALLNAGKEVGRVRVGEVFGELAAITDAPRSATAVARTDCRLIALDGRRFEAALRKKPAFALMLMSVMVKRLRDTIAQLEAEGELSADKAGKEGRGFDPKHLVLLARGLSDDPLLYYDRNRVIVQAGQKGFAESMLGSLAERVRFLAARAR